MVFKNTQKNRKFQSSFSWVNWVFAARATTAPPTPNPTAHSKQVMLKPVGCLPQKPARVGEACSAYFIIRVYLFVRGPWLFFKPNPKWYPQKTTNKPYEGVAPCIQIPRSTRNQIDACLRREQAGAFTHRGCCVCMCRSNSWCAFGEKSIALLCSASRQATIAGNHLFNHIVHHGFPWLPTLLACLALALVQWLGPNSR